MDIITKVFILCAMAFLASRGEYTKIDRFNRMDLDHNGVLSLDELFATFDRIDTNGDNAWTLDEIEATGLSKKVQETFNKMDKLDQQADGKVGRSVVPYFFRGLDLDGNGEVSLKEFLEKVKID